MGNRIEYKFVNYTLTNSNYRVNIRLMFTEENLLSATHAGVLTTFSVFLAGYASHLFEINDLARLYGEASLVGCGITAGTAIAALFSPRS